ncbi:MAG: peroxiredoxin-like family protein [Nitrospirales bacterium]
MTKLLPRTHAPELEVKTIEGNIWKLSKLDPPTFTMIVFYRGLHCPICKTYLKDLEGKWREFTKRGVEMIAISGDTEERATKSKQEWGLEQLMVGYDQAMSSMREWGLYISHRIKDSEPAQFGEPGVFLIRPGGELYYIAINSMPFGRPSFRDLLSTVDWVTENSYPARGEA